MKDYKFKFSVIIPVYKVEEYLEETVESVLNQTIGFEDNIQIILVNDGSPDNSGEICEKYQKLYPDNIEYIVQENAGVSAARNAGIELVKGKYVNFLDSDDKWSEDAFEKAYAFFEEHYDETDVLAVRIQFFGSKTTYHVLDYKFDCGDRIVDLSEPKNSKIIQLSAASTIIKAEVLVDSIRFDSRVKYGEDSLFINSIILDKAKLGILASCVYLYRRRSDLTSTIQTQKYDPDFYTGSPRLYYAGVIEQSILRFGKVVEYIQNVLAYDIGWRAMLMPPEDIVSDKQALHEYRLFLKDILSYVDDKIILTSKVHRRIVIKDALFRLKYGENNGLYEKAQVKDDKNDLYYKDTCICRLKKTLHNCCIHICTVQDEKLIMEGVVVRWLFDCIEDSETSFALMQGKKLYPIKLKDNPLIKEKTFFGEKNRYYRFRVAIPFSRLFKKKDSAKLKFAFCVDSKPFVIGVKYGKYIPCTAEFPNNYLLIKNIFIKFNKTDIVVEKYDDPRTEYRIREKQCTKWLKDNNMSDLARIRIGCRLFKKFVLKGRRLWLISDRFEFARDNGKAFFKYLSEHPEKTKNILPVFVISKYSPDVPEIKKLGKTVFLEDKKFLYYYLCADKNISSTAAEFILNPIPEEKRNYLINIRKWDFVFLQHGIIKDDLSGWLNKFSKNISTFIVSGQAEYDSIINGNYLYGKRNIAITGLARFDALENNPQKLVCIIPTWRKYISQSYDANTNSVYYEGFKEDDYFKFYNNLINDERLLDCMRKKGYKGLFCLHPIHAKQYIDYQGNDVFTINNTEVDYTKVFSEGSLLITDFSSVFFDFAYLKKPVVYAHFDKKKFFETHSYDEGYFSYEDDGFGPVCYDYESTVDAIIGYIENGCKNPQKYIDRVEAFFKYIDHNNCERIYKAVTKKKK